MTTTALFSGGTAKLCQVLLPSCTIKVTLSGEDGQGWGQRSDDRWPHADISRTSKKFSYHVECLLTVTVEEEMLILVVQNNF